MQTTLHVSDEMAAKYVEERDKTDLGQNGPGHQKKHEDVADLNSDLMMWLSKKRDYFTSQIFIYSIVKTSLIYIFSMPN